MKTPETKQTFAAMTALESAVLWNLAKGHVTEQKTLEKREAAFTSGHRQVGKVISALKLRHKAAQSESSFRDYHKQNKGGLPNNHAEACSIAFTGFVLGDLVKEEIYDRTPTDWLETACSILNLCKLDLTRPEVLESASIINAAPDDGRKQLKEIQKALKGAGSGAGEGEGEDEGEAAPKQLTPAALSAAIRQAFELGFHGYVLAELVAEIHHAKARPDATQELLFRETLGLVRAWEMAGIEDSKLEAWSAPEQKTPANAPADLRKAA